MELWNIYERLRHEGDLCLAKIEPWFEPRHKKRTLTRNVIKLR